MEFNVKIHCEIDVKLVFHEMLWKKISQCILPFRFWNFLTVHWAVWAPEGLKVCSTFFFNIKNGMKVFVLFLSCILRLSNHTASSFPKLQKQPFRGVVLRNFAKFTRNTCARVSFLIKLQALASNFIKKRLWHRCFPANFAKFLRIPFFTEHLQRLRNSLF